MKLEDLTVPVDLFYGQTTSIRRFSTVCVLYYTHMFVLRVDCAAL